MREYNNKPASKGENCIYTAIVFLFFSNYYCIVIHYKYFLEEFI